MFSAKFVMRDVIFLAGMAGAGLADIIDVRVMIIAASLILCVVGVVALFVPGIGRPAAEWRRGVAPCVRARAGGRWRRRARAARDGRRLRAARRPRRRRSRRLNAAQRAGVPRRTRPSARSPTGARVIAQGDAATSAYFILDGEAAAGIPEADGSYRGLSTMSAGDFFGEIGALTGQHAHGGRRRDPALDAAWRSRRTRCAP